MRSKRPKKRADCISGPRPCPWVGCKYHLLFDYKLMPARMRFLTDEEIIELLWEMPETCALDVAEYAHKRSNGKLTLQYIADLLGLDSRERVRQITEEGCKLWKSEIFLNSSSLSDYSAWSTKLESAT